MADSAANKRLTRNEEATVRLMIALSEERDVKTAVERVQREMDSKGGGGSASADVEQPVTGEDKRAAASSPTYHDSAASATRRWELSILVGPCERDDAEDLLVDVLDFIRKEILPVATVDFGPVGALRRLEGESA